jgi:hypothetical protein
MANQNETTSPTEEISPSDPIGPKARHDARMVMGNESVRGLFMINGGGAVALLAFLQQLWAEQPDLARWVMAGLALFTLGIAFAAPISQLRAESSLAHQYGPPERAHCLRGLHIALTWLSIIAFVAGCAVVILGGFIALANYA